MMEFDEVLSQIITLLQRDKRVSYRALKRRFDLDDDYLEDLKIEIIKAKRLAVDEEGEVLVWSGEAGSPSEPTPTALPASEPEHAPLSYTPAHLAEKILTSRSALEGERKQVTVLFCDLADSTALAERLGPEAMHTLLNRFFALALDAVHRYEGTINQFLGDGFMALFGAPIAHEDHARRAVLAALALQRSLRDHDAELGSPHGVTCRFRMGLNSGPVVVGSIGDNLRMDYSAVGDTTNLAARLQQLAEPGTILISDATKRLVEGYIRIEVLPPVQVKGKTEPVTPYRVTGTRSQRSPFASRDEQALSQFVGRERELAVLDDLLEQVESGQGQVVGIVAEAGGGKSRLLYEFRQRLQDRHVTYLEGRCLSYGSTMPYHPIIDTVRHNCGMTETDSPETSIEKVRLALQEVGMDAEASAPYLLRLLGIKAGTEALAVLTPEAIKTRTFEALRQMSLKGSEQRPLIVEIENLHWIDQTSEDYLAWLVDGLAGAPILLLVTYRPGYHPPWLDRSYATQISLHSLTPQEGLAVVQSTLQHRELPEHIVQLILERAEGNPFFLEELTRAVIEHGDLQDEISVPDTIQGVIMARIDRLPEAPKRLLQTASVLGREFSPRLLESIWDGPGTLQTLLLELKHLEFLFERTGVGEPVYVFKQSLTQEVAYDSLLTTHRQRLHAVAGEALEALYAGRLEDAYDRLAYHYGKTDYTARAVEYLTRHAEKAARSYAHVEAVAALKEACRHAERLPTSERDRRLLELTLQQTSSLTILGRYQEALDLLLEHRERLDRLREPSLAGPYDFWLGHTYTYLGQQQQAAEHAQRALELAQQYGDQATMGKAAYVLARSSLWSAQLRHSLEHGQQAVALLQRTEEQWWLGQTYWVMGVCYLALGAFASALEALDRTRAIGEALGDPRLQTYAAWNTGNVYTNMGEWEAAIEACRRGLEHSPDPVNTTMALGCLGNAYLGKDDPVEAIPLLEQAVQRMGQFGTQYMQGFFMAALSEAYLETGQIDKAHDLANQALAISQSVHYGLSIGLAQRVLGRIAQTRGDFAAAESHFGEALQTYTSMQARHNVGRVHLALASLAHTQGKQDAATNHLTKAHTLFTTLQVPRYKERAEQLAHEWNLTLAEAPPGESI